MSPTSSSLPATDVLARAAGLPPLVTAVAHPCDEPSLAGVIAARDRGLVAPILIGPEEKIRRVAAEAGLDLAGLPLDPVPHSHAAAARAVELVRRAEARAIMKGSLHTDELMAAIVARESGLRTTRRISHAFVMGVPGHPRMFIITDAAVNIAPDLEAKRDIVCLSVLWI
jgi:phosphate acetyltransferase